MQKTFHYTNDSIEFSLKENIFELKGNLFLSETDTQKMLFFLKGYNPAPNTEIKFLFKIIIWMEISTIPLGAIQCSVPTLQYYFLLAL